MAGPEGHPPHEAIAEKHHWELDDHVEAMIALFSSLRALAPVNVFCGRGEGEVRRGARSEAWGEVGEARDGVRERR